MVIIKVMEAGGWSERGLWPLVLCILALTLSASSRAFLHSEHHSTAGGRESVQQYYGMLKTFDLMLCTKVNEAKVGTVNTDMLRDCFLDGLHPPSLRCDIRRFVRDHDGVSFQQAWLKHCVGCRRIVRWRWRLSKPKWPHCTISARSLRSCTHKWQPWQPRQRHCRPHCNISHTFLDDVKHWYSIFYTQFYLRLGILSCAFTSARSASCKSAKKMVFQVWSNIGSLRWNICVCFISSGSFWREWLILFLFWVSLWLILLHHTSP